MILYTFCPSIPIGPCDTHTHTGKWHLRIWSYYGKKLSQNVFKI